MTCRTVPNAAKIQNKERFLEKSYPNRNFYLRFVPFTDNFVRLTDGFPLLLQNFNEFVPGFSNPQNFKTLLYCKTF